MVSTFLWPVDVDGLVVVLEAAVVVVDLMVVNACDVVVAGVLVDVFAVIITMLYEMFSLLPTYFLLTT